MFLVNMMVEFSLIYCIDQTNSSTCPQNYNEKVVLIQNVGRVLGKM